MHLVARVDLYPSSVQSHSVFHKTCRGIVHEMYISLGTLAPTSAAVGTGTARISATAVGAKFESCQKDRHTFGSYGLAGYLVISRTSQPAITVITREKEKQKKNSRPSRNPKASEFQTTTATATFTYRPSQVLATIVLPPSTHTIDIMSGHFT
ncbi:uncharacterized protein ARMOST_11195 [Armillaria ostoyae]|uniref:Uncharacterized protein n=1 Tax=Armillaria ostoyae TaxID=47428 RepID=A0A284RGH7_ARMOS|nr:uncharacterized protein ARMOST_11195 [Armillaria ostoyae]